MGEAERARRGSVIGALCWAEAAGWRKWGCTWRGVPSSPMRCSASLKRGLWGVGDRENATRVEGEFGSGIVQFLV